LTPNNPDRPLTPAEICAILARGRTEAEAGQGTDLEMLLAQWEAEDATGLPTQRPNTPSAA
jgi:hypothetical protein